MDHPIPQQFPIYQPATPVFLTGNMPTLITINSYLSQQQIMQQSIQQVQHLGQQAKIQTQQYFQQIQTQQMFVQQATYAPFGMQSIAMIPTSVFPSQTLSQQSALLYTNGIYQAQVFNQQRQQQTYYYLQGYQNYQGPTHELPQDPEKGNTSNDSLGSSNQHHDHPHHDHPHINASAQETTEQQSNKDSTTLDANSCFDILYPPLDSKHRKTNKPPISSHKPTAAKIPKIVIEAVHDNGTTSIIESIEPEPSDTNNDDENFEKVENYKNSTLSSCYKDKQYGKKGSSGNFKKLRSLKSSSSQRSFSKNSNDEQKSYTPKKKDSHNHSRKKPGHKSNTIYSYYLEKEKQLYEPKQQIASAKDANPSTIGSTFKASFANILRGKCSESDNTSPIRTTNVTENTFSNEIEAKDPMSSEKSDDTMQRNGSKASQGSNAKGQKNDTADLGVAMNGKSQQQQANKQRKTKAGNNGNKRQENVAATNQQKHSSGFSVDEWLGRGVLFCYDRGSRSSSAGDNSLPRHNPGHRNSASSETGASDDLSSGNSDSCSKATTSKKSRRLRQKRQQQQQQQSQQRAINNTNNNNNNNNNNNKNEKQQRNKSQQNQQQNQINNNSNDDDDAGPNHRADIEEETKENRRKSYNNNSTTSTTITTSNNNTSNDAGNNSGSKLTCQQQQNKSNQNLRKQSTKLATTLRGASGNAGATNSSDKTHQQQQRHFGTGAGGAAGATNKVKNSFSMNSLKNTSGNNKGSALSGSSSSTSLSSSGSSANSSPASSPKNSPTSSPIAFKRANTFFKRQLLQRQFPQSVLDYVVVDEEEFIRYLKRLVIDPNLLRIYGYPVDSTVHEGCVEIFKCLPKHIIQAKAQHLANQANRHNNVINSNDGLYINGYNGQDAESTDSHSGDSGRGSCDSSPASVDSDSSENGEDETNGITAFYTPDGIYQIFSQYDNSLEKQCVRCKNAFMVTSEGEYLTDEACFYHLGKLNPLYEGESIKGWQYNCCQGSEFALGCCSNALHVWTGAAVGLNGPYHDFVRTVRKAPSERTKPKAYALDCEMSFTGRGLEVTKVTMVSHNGHLVYETFVRPKAEIVDYNTRFSGITEEDLSIHSTNVKCLQEVQKDLLELIDADTFLIGHGLDNDLRVLRILHKKVIDTSISFPHTNGFPFRRALRHLMKVYLNRDIQTGDKGHSSFEDSRACLELLMWKLRRELRINFFD